MVLCLLSTCLFGKVLLFVGEGETIGGCNVSAKGFGTIVRKVLIGLILYCKCCSVVLDLPL